MNTIAKNTYLPKTGNNVIILEELEFGYPEKQLKEIQDDWNDGVELEQIAWKQKRPADEIFLALFHLGRKGKIKRKFGCRYI
ncbi:hypothetical protein [Halobacillus ihumii]|uniref:hypothetical protein n=1 Tax=Halobacillus ihumii TaxID=2686092 RepID=UPI0013CFBD1E|nr:hypothetical protein [Halobacillus ihumii]